MARRELGPAALRVARAVASVLPTGPVIVGVSGGADSLALTLGAAWAAPRVGASVRAVVVDHGLQVGSRTVAEGVVGALRGRGIVAEVRTAHVSDDSNLEAAAREARLAALSRDGEPVLLGHTLDDQAETVLLGLLRGSGTRSLAGMAVCRGPFLRPLLGIRRDQTRQACRDWEITWWEDPMNSDARFARVRARLALATLTDQLGRDVALALARTAKLARIDADLLDELAGDVAVGEEVAAGELAAVPKALRWRALQRWLRERGATPELVHVRAVDALVTSWRGQGPVQVPGGEVTRRSGRLAFRRMPD